MEYNMKKSALQSSAYLLPLTEKIPHELKNIPRWVVWKNKMPFDARCANSNASVSDEQTWSTYEQALTAYEEGGYDGIGFVFNGDGLVGIDIDACVIDGVASESAMSLMYEIGCGYIEISPSGTGLHGLGYALNCKPKGRRGIYKGVNVELYSTKRFFTITGHVIQDGRFRDLAGFFYVYDNLKSSITTEDTEDTEETDSMSSVDDFVFPTSTILTAYGQRNAKLFELARHLKGRHPDASCDDMIPLLKQWHSLHIDMMRTKDFTETRIDFEYAWNKVEHPSTFIFEKIAKEKPVTFDSIAAEVYGQAGGLLMHICQELQKLTGKEPFFISVRTAGAQLNIHHTSAAKLLKNFVQRKWLVIEAESTPRKASRYRIP